MKPIKITLRIWIALTSMVSFLTGWALLSHAPKPVSLFATAQPAQPAQPFSGGITGFGAVVAQLPDLPPVPSLDSILSNPNAAANTQALPSLPQINPNVKVLTLPSSPVITNTSGNQGAPAITTKAS
jgi:hypothetical protein